MNTIKIGRQIYKLVKGECHIREFLDIDEKPIFYYIKRSRKTEWLDDERNVSKKEFEKFKNLANVRVENKLAPNNNRVIYYHYE